MKNRKRIASLVLLWSILMSSFGGRVTRRVQILNSEDGVPITQEDTYDAKANKPKYLEVIDPNDLNMIERYGYTVNDTVMYYNPIYRRVLHLVNREQLVYVVGEYLGYSQVIYEIRDGQKVIGYIPNNDVEFMNDKFIEVDISLECVRTYMENTRREMPTVTGVPNVSPTELGLFRIYDKARCVNLVGKDYVSYVDYWMPFDGKIGMHNAEYHTCTAGGSHGWRNSSEFGGDTYIERGSHGCVNLLNEDAKYIYDNYGIGTKVLVHK